MRSYCRYTRCHLAMIGCCRDGSAWESTLGGDRIFPFSICRPHPGHYLSVPKTEKVIVRGGSTDLCGTITSVAQAVSSSTPSSCPQNLPTEAIKVIASQGNNEDVDWPESHLRMHRHGPGCVAAPSVTLSTRLPYSFMPAVIHAADHTHVTTLVSALCLPPLLRLILQAELSTPCHVAIEHKLFHLFFLASAEANPPVSLLK